LIKDGALAIKLTELTEAIVNLEIRSVKLRRVRRMPVSPSLLSFLMIDG
jgi:hypothetical protein